MPRSKKDRRWTSPDHHHISTYESFRHRATVADIDLTSSFGYDSINISGETNGRSICLSESLIEVDETDENKESDEKFVMSQEVRESLKQSLIPMAETPRRTALQRLQTAVQTAAVTNELLSLLNDSVENTDKVKGILGPNGSNEKERPSLKSVAHAVIFLNRRNNIIEKELTHPRNAGEYTVIAFVNSASGGGKGEELYKTLQSHLGESYVIDLKACRPGNMPEDTLIKYAADPMVRVLACGGDGTCGWIFSSLDKVWLKVLGERSLTSRIHLSSFKDHLPLAIMPLGTGNDLSRQFHWGGSFKESMKKKGMIQSVQRGKLEKLDRWRCTIMPFHELSEEEKSVIPSILAGANSNLIQQLTEEMLEMREGTKTRTNRKSRAAQRLSSKRLSSGLIDASMKPSDQFFDGVFCNYLSLGFDATVAYLFHREREEHPEKFTSPTKNKLIYIQKSPAALKAPKLRGNMKIMVAEEDGTLVKLPIPKSCRAVVLMNIRSYGGGNHLTNEGSPTDGLIEVIFVSNLISTAAKVAMGKAFPFVLFNVAAKTNRVIFRTKIPLHCQVDGEPWLEGEGIIQVKFHARNAILEKVKEDTNLCDCKSSAEDAVVG